MMRKTWVRRLGTVLTLTALAAFVWGCGQTAPTAVAEVEDEPTMGTMGGDPPPDDGSSDGGNDGWW